MNNTALIRRFGRLAARFRPRPHWGLALSVLLAVLPWLTAFTFIADAPEAVSASTVNPGWRHYAGTEMRFAYPPNWRVESDEENGEAAYRLVSPDQRLRIRLTLARLDGPTDMRSIERRLVHTVESERAFERHFIRIVPAKRLGGHAMAAIEYVATGADDAKTRGLRLGRPAADGQMLLIDVTAPASVNLHTDMNRIRQIAETLVLAEADPATS